MEEKTSVLSQDSLRNQWWHGDDLLKEIQKRTGDTILLGFSRGKDSIAAWLHLRDSGIFKHIIPIHLYLIPGLSFVDDNLKYFEDIFQTHIINMPHPSLYRYLRNNIFVPPGRIWKTIDFFCDMNFDYNDINNAIKKQYNLSETTLQANGVRACDSMVRRIALRDHGPFGPGNVKVIWDWSKPDVMDIINRNNIKLPVDYEMFGRSFDGIGYQYAKPIKDKFPKDYQKMIDWFPMLEAEIFRFENLENNSNMLVHKNGRYIVNYEEAKKQYKYTGADEAIK